MSAVNNFDEQLRATGSSVKVGLDLKDVDDQALMRGLVSAFAKMRPGLSLSYNGRRLSPATKRLTGIPPAVI